MTDQDKPVARGWVWLLWAAAVYNLVAGLPALVSPAAPVSDRVVGLLVVCFGLVYAMVARAPVRLGPVLWAGVAGKAGVIALLLPGVLAGQVQSGMAPAALAPVLAGDALFGLAFLAFLLRR